MRHLRSVCDLSCQRSSSPEAAMKFETERTVSPPWLAQRGSVSRVCLM